MMSEPNFDPRDRVTVLIHYYRAMVGRADIWRTRMDVTANWAIGATFAITTLTLGTPTAPHYVMFIASLMTMSFLMLEARRLTFYRLWQERVLLLEDGLIRPALSRPSSSGVESAEAQDDLNAKLDIHLGRTVPDMPLKTAVARRLRRMYLYLFAVQLLAWVFKLSVHPTSIDSVGDVINRAQIAFVPGALVIAVVVALLAAGLGLTFAVGGVDRGE
jgi:uncharacterized membrane protein